VRGRRRRECRMVERLRGKVPSRFHAECVFNVFCVLCL
jgi:hypothetical protein